MDISTTESLAVQNHAEIIKPIPVITGTNKRSSDTNAPHIYQSTQNQSIDAIREAIIKEQSRSKHSQLADDNDDGVIIRPINSKKKTSTLSALRGLIADRVTTDYTPFTQRLIDAINEYDLPTGIAGRLIKENLQARGFTIEQLRELHGITNPCTQGEIAVGSLKLSVLHPLKFETIRDVHDPRYSVSIKPFQRVWAWDFTPFGVSNRITYTVNDESGSFMEIPNREYQLGSLFLLYNDILLLLEKFQNKKPSAIILPKTNPVMARAEIDRMGFHLKKLVITNKKTGLTIEGDLDTLHHLAEDPSALTVDDIAEAEVFIKPEDLFSEESITRLRQGRDAIAKKILAKETITQNDRDLVEQYFRLKAISENLSQVQVA